MKSLTLLTAVLLNVVTAFAGDPQAQWTQRERMLLSRIERLERRLAEVEERLSRSSTEVARAAESASAAGGTDRSEKAERDSSVDTTLSATLDGYYGYNFNRPAGGANLLRAYDGSSNSFSLNQAAVIIEQAPNLRAGRRFGGRLDLQYGQATETLQGNPANELRPQVYRSVFQAYGTYVLPVGRGIAVDFGKWASALGIENNYTKDQWNYSRSYYFAFLPFYHFGFRAAYSPTDKASVAYWLVNGAQQSEDFNAFKSQAVLLNVKPKPRLSWNLNYYSGIEGRDVGSNTGVQPPGGRLHIMDTYAVWELTDKLALAAEADYVISRRQRSSAPSHALGGAAYARYRFTPVFAVAGRVEYLSDRGGLFSGATQALKETTFTADYRAADGFLLRAEWRRDFSNQPFFLSQQAGVRKHEQNTATLGLIWWFGGKKGAW